MPRYAAKPRVKMSKQELTLVKYVVRQLTAAYTDNRGKPKYARNMDQVMKDIFGIKRFTKCLERGVRNEYEMIALMKALDLQTIWTICRSSEHYRMLCSLVAMDSAIVKLQKRSDEYLTMNPQDRPGRKYAKAQKELKRLQKSYNRSVKVFRDIFDIKSRNSGSTIRGIMEFAENWRDRNSMGDDIFGYFDDSPMMDTVESMDAFVRRNTPKGMSRDAKRPERGSGAFGIFDDGPDYSMGDDDEGYFDEEEDEEPSFSRENMDELVDRLAAMIQQRYPMPKQAPAARYPGPNSYVAPPQAPMPTVPMSMDQRMTTIEQNLERNNALVGQLIDALSGSASSSGGDYYEEDLGELMIRRAPGSEVSMEEALAMANNGAPDPDPDPEVQSTPESTPDGDNPS